MPRPRYTDDDQARMAVLRQECRVLDCARTHHITREEAARFLVRQAAARRARQTMEQYRRTDHGAAPWEDPTYAQ